MQLQKMLAAEKDVFDPEAPKIDPRVECISHVRNKKMLETEELLWTSFIIKYAG